MPLALVLAALARTVAWQWDAATPDLFPRVDLVATSGAASYRLALTDQLRLSGAGWSIEFPDGVRDELTGAAMVADADRVYVATYDRIATGCDLAAYAASDGHQVWAVGLDGAGPVAHSKYSNRVQLRLIDGKPTVFGAEAAHRYIEIRDPATGALISNTLLPAARVERPLAEPLFQELDGQLATRDRYDVDIADFAERHHPGDKPDRGAFAAAALLLDGTPLQHGRYTLAVELVGDRVIAARR